MRHPMPNTAIALRLNDGGVLLQVAIPLPELRLAMQQDWPEQAREDAPPLDAIAQYVRRHFQLRALSGAAIPYAVQSMTIWDAADENVGAYQEFRASILAPAVNGFDTRHFILEYDAVIHQIPNHFALVEIIQDFRRGVLAGDSSRIAGVIRFDFARNTTPPLSVDAGAGHVSEGVRATIALGFRHVLQGADHLLFLLTLLIVAPLRVIDKRWSLLQGWGYASRRFLTISVAFTIGHSVALVFGAYALLTIPRTVVETLIALSIAIAAAHAIRPLFPNREWIVALTFGTIHGLAFAETIAALELGALDRALAVGGFNVGVEGAQLCAMACAVPLLAVSRWHIYHGVRLALMTGAIILALIWAVQRAGS